MAEKNEKKTPTLAEYRDILTALRGKFAWARDYL